MQGRAFVEFQSEEAAFQALNILDNMQLWSSKLSVAFATPEDQLQTTNDSENDGDTNSPASSSSSTQSSHPQKRKFGETKTPHSISTKLGINYPFNPHLEYVYPRPEQRIITNITNSLISVPVFYTQVLHLMNKLNLPPPFGAATPTPPLKKRRRPEDELSSSESELEEEETPTSSIEYPLAVDTAFPRHTPTHSRPHLQIKIRSKKAKTEKEEQMPHKEKEKEERTEVEVQNPQVVEERPAEQQFSVISLEELNSNRMVPEEILVLPKFSMYEEGEPSERIYLKNLAKEVTEDDLRYIFGRYFLSKAEMQQGLEIRLMKTCRMKDQAFVAFPTVEQATQALREVHGYILHKKPVIIQFGRKK